MTVRHTIKLIKTLALTASIGLMAAGCTHETPPQENKLAFLDQMRASAVSAEKLLRQEVFTTFAGLNSGEFVSPLERHANAKTQVNPKQTRGTLAYTDHPQRSEIIVAFNFRTLKLEPAGIAPDVTPAAEFQIAQADTSPLASSPIPAPAQKPSALPQNALALAFSKIIPSMSSKPEQGADKSVASIGGRKVDRQASKVTNLRMGDYADKTRLVLDLSSQAKFDYDLNNLSSTLTVHIDGAKWNTKMGDSFKNHPLIQGYSITKSNAGDTILKIDLKKPSRMVMSGLMRPDQGLGHRIFFDVAAL